MAILFSCQGRSCLLKMPAVLQTTLLKIFRHAVGMHFVSSCV